MTTNDNSSPSSAMLLRRLKSSEKVLQELLKSVNSSLSADSLIERRLTQLEELVLTIPETNSTMVAEWDEKVVALWKAYAEGRSRVDDHRSNVEVSLEKHQPSEAENMSTESVQFSTVKDKDASVSMGDASQDSADEVDSAKTLLIQELTSLEITLKKLLAEKPVSFGLMKRQLSLLLREITQIPKCYEQLYDEWTARVSELMAQFAVHAETSAICHKQSVIYSPSKGKQGHGGQVQRSFPRFEVEVQIRKAFDRFAYKKVAGGQALSELFYLTAKCFKLTKPVHPSDTAFGTRIFDLAFSKLHPSLADQYYSSSNSGNTKLLIDMCSFLSRSIQMDQAPLGDGYEKIYCKFCGQKGHSKNNCVRVLNRLCYSCFQKGHDWKSCPNHTLTQEELLKSL